jgi:hypothetical protein
LSVANTEGYKFGLRFEDYCSGGHMRNLTASEWCIIRNLMASRGLEPGKRGSTKVREECYLAPRRRSSRFRFNCDFVLDFSHEWDVDRSGYTLHQILPKNLGAELVLVTNKHGKPCRMEMLNGEAFGFSLYRRFMKTVDSFVGGLVTDGTLPFGQTIETIAKTGGYLRIIVVGKEVSFLACSCDPKSYLASELRTVCRKEGELEYLVEGDRLAGVSGWVTHAISPSRSYWRVCPL